MAMRTDLRADGERDLAERILKEPGVRQVIERFEKLAEESGARRHLLATSLHLTAEMAPDVHEIVEACRVALGLETPLETYVYPELQFNAAGCSSPAPYSSRRRPERSPSRR